jgi:hypothetical protein
MQPDLAIAESLASLPTAERLAMLVDSLITHDLSASIENLLEVSAIMAKYLEPHQRCEIFELLRASAFELDAQWQ